MIYYLLVAMTGIISLQYFTLNYSIQGLNRAIISTPIEIMYKSVQIFGEAPLFKKADFEMVVRSYYEEILPKYTKDYSVSFYYYNSSDGSMSLTDDCNGVEISINCKLNLTYNYYRVMFYEMSEAKAL